MSSVAFYLLHLTIKLIINASKVIEWVEARLLFSLIIRDFKWVEVGCIGL